MKKRKDYFVLADGSKYYFNTFQNKNAILLGPSGSGKSTLGIIMNMLNMNKDNSCVVIDVKGQLYKNYKDVMEDKGFIVKNLSFINPNKSTDYYNPLAYIKSSKDIVELTEILTNNSKTITKEIFWGRMEQIALNSVIGYSYENRKKDKDKFNLSSAIDMLKNATITSSRYDSYCSLDNVFEKLKETSKDSWAVSQYAMLNKSVNAPVTFSNILASTLGNFSNLDSIEIRNLLSKDTIDIESIGKKPTCLFVEVSDTDRSLDFLVNLFITQCMSLLCRQADNNKDGSLKMKTNFLIDDAGSSVKLVNLESYISNIRSRNISLTLSLQSLGQLTRLYGEGKSTIVDSSDIVEVFGSNDIDTAREISIRLDKSISEVLNMKLGSCYVLIRGEKPRYIGQLRGLDEYLKDPTYSNDYLDNDLIIYRA